MIIFVGDKPSNKNIDPNVAFVDTKSYRTLLGWIADLEISVNDIMICNKYSIIEKTVDKHFIALGNEAEKHLSSLGITYFKLPHPSGRNRLLNDATYVKKILQECRRWLGEA